jgi:hypothetical protein
MVQLNMQAESMGYSWYKNVMERELLTTIDPISGACDIGSPTADGNPSPEGSTKTLLTSYPGSGKRFTWTLVKALTNSEVADDWNFSEKLNFDPIMVKTSFPHKEGTWSFGDQMDQVILLVRNPRWAIPSYHNMRYELDYAADWASSYVRVPFTYTDRPAILNWLQWRNANFGYEMNNWAYQIDFWMSGGFSRNLNATNPLCTDNKIECTPVTIIDFDNLYKTDADGDFYRLSTALTASENVPMVEASIQDCVLNKVYERKDLHQGNRPTDTVIPSNYIFTANMFIRMLEVIDELRIKYAAEPWTNDPKAQHLVSILNRYYDDIEPQKDYMMVHEGLV